MHSIVFEMYCVTFSDNRHTPFIRLKFLTFAGFFVLVAFIQTYEMAWKMNGKLLIESVPLYVRRVCVLERSVCYAKNWLISHLFATVAVTWDSDSFVHLICVYVSGMAPRFFSLLLSLSVPSISLIYNF